MILLDADVLWIDLAVPTDKRYPVNRRALAALGAGGYLIGVTLQALLEIVGKRSYGTPTAAIPVLPGLLLTQYGLRVVPDPVAFPDYAGCTIQEVLAQMGTKMTLGDAVQAVQVAKYIPNATALLTWNAKHFTNKIPIPVLTPAEWLTTLPPPGP